MDDKLNHNLEPPKQKDGYEKPELLTINLKLKEVLAPWACNFEASSCEDRFSHKGCSG